MGGLIGTVNVLCTRPDNSTFAMLSTKKTRLILSYKAFLIPIFKYVFFFGDDDGGGGGGLYNSV